MNKIVNFVATKASQAGGYLLRKGKQVVSNARFVMTALFASVTGLAFADGDAGAGAVSAGAGALQGVTSEIAAYLPYVQALIYIIAAVLTAPNAISVFHEWQNGDQEAKKHTIALVGGAIFLVVAVQSLPLFFGAGE